MDLQEHLSGVDSSVATVVLAVAGKGNEIRNAFAFAGSSGTKNVYGEVQDNLEKVADALLIGEMKRTGVVRTIASEEQPEAIDTGKGELGVVFDPLDGSSCIATNCAVGTIAGIFKGPIQGDVTMVGSLYMVYGPRTTLVYSVGDGTHEFVLQDKNFMLKRENMSIPEGTVLSPGGLKKDVTPSHRRVLEGMENEGFKLRYTGSFVADMNQIMEYGGCYTYPALVHKPGGKIRLLFEAYPLAYIVHHAGGAATNGKENILDVRPSALSERTPLYIGSKKVVEGIRV